MRRDTSDDGEAVAVAQDDSHVVVCKVMDYVIRCNKARRAVRQGDVVGFVTALPQEKGRI